MSNVESYYVRRMGRVEGPWDIGKLQSEVKLRKLGRYHEVSVDGRLWLRAHDINGLFPSVEARKTIGVRPKDGIGRDESVTDELELEASEPVWHGCFNNTKCGPMSFGELVQAVTNGHATLDDLVWRDGFNDWTPIEQVPELMRVIDRQVSDRTQTISGDTRFVATAPENSVWAMASLGTGSVSLLFSWIPLMGFLGAVAAGISVFALFQIKNSGGKLKGTPMAIIGAILGILAVVIALLVFLVVGLAFIRN